eukprot:14633113-Alexandrium_andersonii.AAC.1
MLMVVTASPEQAQIFGRSQPSNAECPKAPYAEVCVFLQLPALGAYRPPGPPPKKKYLWRAPEALVVG